MPKWGNGGGMSQSHDGDHSPTKRVAVGYAHASLVPQLKRIKNKKGVGGASRSSGPIPALYHWDSWVDCLKTFYMSKPLTVFTLREKIMMILFALLFLLISFVATGCEGWSICGYEIDNL